MPLHLLGKKSWNVYNSDNILRVRRDEAELAAREAALDELTQTQDAAIRTALLRGETPPSFAPVDATSALLDDGRGRTKRRFEDDGSGGLNGVLSAGDQKARRRKRGEDESDYAIRLATLTATNRVDPSAGSAGSGTKNRDGAVAREERLLGDRNAPILDQAGNIQLFAAPASLTRATSTSKEAKTTKPEIPDTFETVGASKPWYATGVDTTTTTTTTTKKTNVFGRPDEKRGEREAKRMVAEDPLAAIMKAQGELKRARREREVWGEGKEKERRALEEAQREERRARRREREGGERGERREGERRRGREGSVGSLEGFELDAPASRGIGDERRRRHRHRHRHRDDDNGREGGRSKARSRSPTRIRHRTSRSRERGLDSASHRREHSRSYRH